MRDLFEVHRRIVAVIPDPKVSKELQERGDALLGGYVYAAPETHYNYWRHYCRLLDGLLGDPAKGSEWKMRVHDILEGRTCD